jgi:diamine N-acetyltransferase
MITLRPLAAGDVDVVFRWENLPELWQVSEQTGPFSREEIFEFHSRCIDSSNHEITRWLICCDSIPIGAVDVFDFDRKSGNCGLGIFIADSHMRRKGHATKALALALGLLQNEGCVLVKAIIYDDNSESIRLFIRAGFIAGGSFTYKGKPAHQYICNLSK